MLRSRFARLLCGLLPALTAQAIRIEVTPTVVAAGDPDDDRYRTPVGAGYDGIAALAIRTMNGQDFSCTGALLSTGRVLTAAHCLTDATGSLNVASMTATFFPSTGGREVIAASGFNAHPEWSGSLVEGADVGVVSLSTKPSAGVQRYELYDGAEEIGSTYEFAGWGLRGTGATGYESSMSAMRRRGFNTFDATMKETFSEFEGWIGGDSVLVSDFDNGFALNDALGLFYDIQHLGVGLDEASTAPGDSGAPAFIGGRIAGISSFRLRLEFEDGETSDVDGLSNGSFGEFNTFTRLSSHSQWINAIPEPSTMALCAAFAVLMAGRSMLRRKPV